MRPCMSEGVFLTCTGAPCEQHSSSHALVQRCLVSGGIDRSCPEECKSSLPQMHRCMLHRCKFSVRWLFLSGRGGGAKTLEGETPHGAPRKPPTNPPRMATERPQRGTERPLRGSPPIYTYTNVRMYKYSYLQIYEQTHMQKYKDIYALPGRGERREGQICRTTLPDVDSS